MPANDKQKMLSDTDSISLGLPVDSPVGVPLGGNTGAIQTGPTSIGNFSVMGRTILPGHFNVAGDRYSVVNTVLQPGESYEAESGAMMFMSNDVHMEAAFGGWRMLSGEGIAKLKFQNRGTEAGYLGITGEGRHNTPIHDPPVLLVPIPPKFV